MNFEIDPQYVAQTLKNLRKMHGWSGEALAATCSLTTRTIENAESGRTTPQWQTLVSLAEAFKVNVSIFRKPSPIEEADFQRSMVHAAKHTVMAPTKPIGSPKDFLDQFGSPNALNFSHNEVEEMAAMTIAAEFGDYLKDILDYWNEASFQEKLDMAQSAAEYADKLREAGYLCHVGPYAFQQPLGGRAMVVSATIVSILKANTSDETRYAMIELTPPAESVPSERSALLKEVLETYQAARPGAPK